MPHRYYFKYMSSIFWVLLDFFPNITNLFFKSNHEIKKKLFFSSKENVMKFYLENFSFSFSYILAVTKYDRLNKKCEVKKFLGETACIIYII